MVLHLKYKRQIKSILQMLLNDYSCAATIPLWFSMKAHFLEEPN